MLRFMRITVNDPAYLQLKSRDYSHAGASYKQLYDSHVADCYGWADFWSRALAKLGYECWEPVANAEKMQRRWAEENGLAPLGADWQERILAAQVKQFKPEVLLVDDHNAFTESFLKQLRQACSSLKLVMLWCGAPYKDTEIFRACDFALTNVPELAEKLAEANVPARYLPHAFDPIVLERIGQAGPRSHTIVFAGSLTGHAGYHIRRRELIEALLTGTNLEVYADLWLPNAAQRVRHEIKKIFLGDPPTNELEFVYRLSSSSKQRIHPPVFGREMFRLLRQSKIVVNNHIDVSPRSASNMRLFEVTGVGACLLTDWKENVGEFFEAEKEAVTYRSKEECLEKVRWLAENEAARAAIAKAGQARTLREHTFNNRAQRLHEIISEALLGACPERSGH